MLSEVLRDNAYGASWAESDKMMVSIKKIVTDRRKNDMGHIEQTGKPHPRKHQNPSDVPLDDERRSVRINREKSELSRMLFSQPECDDSGDPGKRHKLSH